MKFPALVLLSFLSFSCRDLDASESSDVATIGPKNDTYVIKGWYRWDPDLERRLSLIMPKGSLSLMNLEGTHVLDKVGLAVSTKPFNKNGYMQIKSQDFLHLKVIPSATTNKIFDVLTYDTQEKIGTLRYDGYDYYLFELCTGSLENLCEFTYDETNKNFSITMLPTPSN